jgi:hypothetical protein
MERAELRPWTTEEVGELTVRLFGEERGRCGLMEEA